MKVTIKAHVHARQTRQYDADTDTFNDAMTYEAYPFDMSKSAYSKDLALIGQQEIEIEVPDDFDPRQQLAENLRAEKKRLMAEFNKRITEIDSQIQTYMAIENKPTEAA